LVLKGKSGGNEYAVSIVTGGGRMWDLKEEARFSKGFDKGEEEMGGAALDLWIKYTIATCCMWVMWIY